MKYMFHKCKNLKYINNLLLFNTRSVTDMSDMFSFCENLNNLDLSSFNIDNTKNLNFMFDYSNNLSILQIFHFKINNKIDNFDKYSN